MSAYVDPYDGYDQAYWEAVRKSGKLVADAAWRARNKPRRFHKGPTIDLERDLAADEQCYADRAAGGWWIERRS